MKICLPTSGKNGLSEIVYNHFGSAPYFTIYETASKTVQVVENDNIHHSHGACHPVGVIKKYGIDVIITNGMGRRAVKMLNDNGIKVYLLNGEKVEEAINKFTKNELIELNFENACSGNHGCH